MLYEEIFEVTICIKNLNQCNFTFLQGLLFSCYDLSVLYSLLVSEVYWKKLLLTTYIQKTFEF